MERVTHAELPIPRSHAWLPDAGLDPHPVGTWALQLGFDLWLRLFYNRVVLLPEDFRVAPGSIIASNHQRDADGPMLGTILVRRRGLRFTWPLPFFATREDLFRPGILARLTVHWPRPVSAVLGRIPLAWFFPLGRAEPMRRVREYTLGEALRALADAGLGDADVASVLNARGRRETGLGPGTCSVRAAIAHHAPPLEAWWGLRRLAPAARTRIAPGFRATIAAQLAHFATRLDHGRCVYFAPEGTLSATGRFGRARAGCYRLAHLTRKRPFIQPMALAYDALAPGRARVLLRVGEHFRIDPALDRRGFDALLRQRVLDLVTITPSHLLARYLAHGPAMFTREELEHWMDRGVAALRAAHPALDPRFEARGIRPIVHRRLRWLERQGVLARAGSAIRNVCPHDAAPGWRAVPNIVRYLDNNLADLVPDVERILPC